MLGIILDAAVIMLIIFLLNQGQDLNWGPAIISALVITVASAVGIGFLGLILGLVVTLGAAIVAIWMISGMPLGKASVAGVIFVVYKIGVGLAWHAMLGGGGT